MVQRWFSIFVVSIGCSIACAQQRQGGQASSARPGSSAPETADSDPRQTQIQAATSNGAAALREQVLRLHLTRDLNVRDFIDQTHSSAGLNDALEIAQPAGGPRWVDDQTCQVQLEIPGSQVAKFLETIATKDPAQSPIKPDALASRLAAWKKLKFSAFGSSAGGSAIDLARPRTTGRWDEIGDHARKLLVEQAQADAVHQVENSLDVIALDDKRTVKDAMTRPLISGRFQGWLDHQPVTRIEFLDDLKVSVTITLSPRSLSRAVKTAITSDAEFQAAGSAIDWDRIKNEIEATPSSAVGTATAAPPAPTSLPLVVLPLQPPDWIDQQLDADGIAHGDAPSLKTGRAAEADAVNHIREKFLQLRIDANTTLGDAAHSDPQLADAIARAMRLARTCKVDYQPNGDVHVSVTMDLHAAWDELRGNP